MIKEILTDPADLVDPSDEVDLKTKGEEARSITLDLKDTIDKYDLNCLSAPQIGYKCRILCIKYKGKGKKSTPTTTTYINPVVTGQRGMVLDRESDPCLPEREFIIPRNQELQVVYQTPTGKAMSQKFTGRAAATMQQMIDHLDGILVDEVGLEIDYMFDTATEEEKNELLEEYMRSLDLYRQQLDGESEEDKDLKQMKDAVDFMRSVRDGETKLGGRIGVTNKNEIVDIPDEGGVAS